MAIKHKIPCPPLILTRLEGLNKTKKELCGLLGVSRRQLYEIEQGRMTWTEFNSLCELTGLKITLTPNEFILL